jgi:hypothetical protein
MRGHKVTERELASILRLLGYQNLDGDWVHSFESIARIVDLSPDTVARHVRVAAVAWGLHTRWRAPEGQDEP